MNDGIYAELFVVKNGVRYNTRIVDMKEVSTILTNGLMDGIEKLWEGEESKANVEEQCNHNWKHEATSYITDNIRTMQCVKKYICTICGEIKTEEEEHNLFYTL